MTSEKLAAEVATLRGERDRLREALERIEALVKRWSKRACDVDAPHLCEDEGGICVLHGCQVDLENALALAPAPPSTGGATAEPKRGEGCYVSADGSGEKRCDKPTWVCIGHWDEMSERRRRAEVDRDDLREQLRHARRAVRDLLSVRGKPDAEARPVAQEATRWLSATLEDEVPRV